MFFIYLVLTIIFLDLFAQLPIISPYAFSLGASPLLAGLIVGIYSFTNIFGNLVSGVYSDKKGVKPLLVGGLSLLSVLLFSYRFVDDATILFTMRLFHGFIAGLVVPSIFSYLGAQTSVTNSGRRMAQSGAAVGLAAVIGPPLGAITGARLGYEAVYTLLSGLMVLALVLVVWRLKEQPRTPKAESVREQTSVSWRAFVWPYVSIFLLLTSLGMLTYNLPLHVERLGLPPERSGMLLSLFGITAILVFVTPLNRFFDRFPKERLMKIGLLTIIAALFLIGNVDSALALQVAMVVYGVGYALIFPTTSARLLELSPTDKHGRAFGVYYALFSIGVVFGSFFSGLLNVSSEELFLVTATFIGACTFLLHTYDRLAAPKRDTVT